ncbi:MAG: hypothetical protein ACR2N6_04230 [Miltoncostaeaceae bacterium]
MSEPAASAADSPTPAEDRWRPWKRRGLIGVIAAAFLLFAILAGAAFIPRWWAQRIGDQVDGSFSAGIGLGLFYGFVFTGLALVVLYLFFRRRRSWKIWAVGLLIAAIVAAPNLMTLGIVLGSGNAAHAGERILDVDAPGFRNASTIGALAALVLVGSGVYLLTSRGRSRRKLKELEQREKDGDSPSAEEDEGSDPRS